MRQPLLRPQAPLRGRMVHVHFVDFVRVLDGEGPHIIHKGSGRLVERLVYSHLEMGHIRHVRGFYIGDAVHHDLEHQVLLRGGLRKDRDELCGDHFFGKDEALFKVIDHGSAGAGPVADAHLPEGIEGQFRDRAPGVDGEDPARGRRSFAGLYCGRPDLFARVQKSAVHVECGEFIFAHIVRSPLGFNVYPENTPADPRRV